MEQIKLEEAIPGQNSAVCQTLEYSFQNKNIDLGVATIKGRFPDTGYAKNLISAELVYVLEGEGRIIFENKSIDFKTGDAILIEPNDKYYYETSFCKLALACTPAWSKDQHKLEA